MSCCGQKRMKLKEYFNSSEKTSLTNITNKKTNTNTFKYIGTGSLILQGALSGNTYHFSSNNPILEVLDADAPAMYAEPLLKNYSN